MKNSFATALIASACAAGLSGTATAATLFSAATPGVGPFGDGADGYGFGGASAAAVADPAGGGGTVSQVTVGAAGAGGGEGVRFSHGLGNPNSPAFPADLPGATYTFSYDIYYPTPVTGGDYDNPLILARWYDSSGTTNKGETAPNYDGSAQGTGYNSVAGFALPDPALLDQWQTVTMAGYTAPVNSSGTGGPAAHLEFNIFTNVANANTADTSVFLRNAQFDYTPVPEPASLVLLGAGGVALLGRRRSA